MFFCNGRTRLGGEWIFSYREEKNLKYEHLREPFKNMNGPHDYVSGPVRLSIKLLRLRPRQTIQRKHKS